MRHYCEVEAIFVLVCDCCRYAIPQIYLATGKVKIRRVTIICQYIAFQSEPVTVVLGVSFAAFGQVARFDNLILLQKAALSVTLI